MSQLQVNDRLTLGSRFKGTVRYIGEVGSREGRWIGLELDDAVGANDGSVNGVRYFQCADKHGIFVRYEKIRGGLVCETKGLSEEHPGPKDQRHLYESKIRRLERTVEMLRGAERDEIARLRRENDGIKRTILSLQGQLGTRAVSDGNDVSVRNIVCSEIRGLVAECRDQVSSAVGLVEDLERCVLKRCSLDRSCRDTKERSRVLFLVDQIVDGALDDDTQRIEHFLDEFCGIMRKYNISVE